MYYSTRNKRRLTYESLMAMPSEPESKAFYTYQHDDDRVEVLNDTFTLVLSRDIRKNTKIAAEIAFSIAKEHNELDVFYVNTYAGVALMKEAFTEALKKSGIPPLPPPASGRGTDEKLPPPASGRGTDAELPPPASGRGTDMELPPPESGMGTDAELPPSASGMGTVAEVENTEVEDTEEEEEDDEEDDEWDDEEDDEDEEPDHGPSVLPNLFIYDVPLGTWDTSRLRRDIEDRGTKEHHPVVILNSFEFASISRGQREKMVMQLIELRDTLGLTFLIFSHEMKRDLAAGLPGRGPLGVISAQSGSVQRMNDPFEHLIRHRKNETKSGNRPKQAENGIVHEAQMRSGLPSVVPSNFARREPYRKIPIFRTEYEKLQWLRLQEDEPDYHADPWLQATEKYGRELLPIARSRLLKRYYEQHMNHLFKKGEEPTEYELETGRYEAKEYEKKWFL
jgi:hypothetical protein